MNELVDRVGCLCSPAKCTGIRASDDDNIQDSLFHQPSSSDGEGASNNGTSDIPNTAIDCRLEGTSLHRRTLMLRGIPDSVVTNGGQLTFGQYTAVEVNRWKNRLVTANWGMRIRNPPSMAVPIVTMVNDFLLGDVTCTTSVPHNLATGDLAYISGRANVPGFNGVWKVVVTSATVFRIQSVQRAALYFIGYKVRKLSFAFQRYTDFIIERATHRITGRPFASPVGRRRARKLR